MIDHEKNLRKAIELSKQSIDSGSSPFGCVIVDAEGKIVGEGHNRVAPDNDPTAHGERLPQPRHLRFERMHSLHFVRTLPDVP